MSVSDERDTYSVIRSETRIYLLMENSFKFWIAVLCVHICLLDAGRIEDPNSESFTHAVFMRFQQKEDIAKFQSSKYYSKVLDDYVKPVSYVRLTM